MQNPSGSVDILLGIGSGSLPTCTLLHTDRSALDQIQTRESASFSFRRMCPALRTEPRSSVPTEKSSKGT